MKTPKTPVEFFFDFSSPYGYLASELIDDLAAARGVFGSPCFIVDGEPFFGVDRLPQLEKWLRTGGF